MPYFYILRVVREDNPLNKSECQVKFYPILTSDGLGEPVQILGEDEREAWQSAKQLFPFHRRNLAIQETVSYDRTVAGLISQRILRGNAAKSSPSQGKGADRERDVGGDSRIPPSGENRPHQIQSEAQLAF
jgi:hypothetical protein